MSKKLIVDIKEKIYRDNSRTIALGKNKFEIKPEKFVCILGPSGCGKSTLLKLISGLDSDYKGEIKLGERKVESPESDCGIVFQEPRLIPWMSVKKNIIFGLAPDKKLDKEKIVRDLLTLMELNHFVNSFPYELSGGMSRKVALARALVNLPDLLLLDEPFTSLDSLTKMKLQEEFSKILREEKTTVLMVTHDIEEAIYLADEILIMSKSPGKIMKSYKIELSMPRNRTSKHFTDLHSTILKYMQQELNLF